MTQTGSVLVTPRGYVGLMRPRRPLQRLLAGHLQNVGFRDAIRLAEAFGFQVVRVRGSHNILAHERIDRQLNLQEVGGEAKPYQIRQLLELVQQYDLELK